MSTVVRPMTVAQVGRVLERVCDPEIPVLTIADLGILRDVQVGPGCRVTVVVTPTYSGCPAMDTIRQEIERALHAAGAGQVEVRTVLSPPWTTDWISEAGRRRLRAYGISPPGPAPAHRADGPVGVSVGRRPADQAIEDARCPRCGSADVRLVSRFGSTACKALCVCRACAEPFDHFKPI